MSVKAGVLITGTEVLTGIIVDRNSGWLADQLMQVGVDHRQTLVVGDSADDIRDGLNYLKAIGCELIVTTGGLGPTADDMTVACVAEFCQRPMVTDDQLQQRIAEILQGIRGRFPNLDQAAIDVSNRKQATVPEGAEIFQPVGTAPGILVTPAGSERPLIVVLPGPPSELKAMWPQVLDSKNFQALLGDAVQYQSSMLRLYGIPESELAKSLREIESEGCDLQQLQVTTCLRRGEIEIATRYTEQTEPIYRQFEDGIRARHGSIIFSDDGRTIDEIVAGLLSGKTVACAESCTGGLLAKRLTDQVGASEYFLGGLVTYSNEAKIQLADVPSFLIQRFGAVSVEVASMLADGAMAAFEAEFGVGITGIAGPGGGSEQKPVGTVCISVASQAGGRISRSLLIPGDREAVRDRSTTVALQLLRKLLLEPELIDIAT